MKSNVCVSSYACTSTSVCVSARVSVHVCVRVCVRVQMCLCKCVREFVYMCDIAPRVPELNRPVKRRREAQVFKEGDLVCVHVCESLSQWQ